MSTKKDARALRRELILSIIDANFNSSRACLHQMYESSTSPFGSQQHQAGTPFTFAALVEAMLLAAFYEENDEQRQQFSEEMWMNVQKLAAGFHRSENGTFKRTEYIEDLISCTSRARDACRQSKTAETAQDMVKEIMQNTDLRGRINILRCMCKGG
jgi:hypothetical protein|tara:strand:- start:665 stop:1135 length:471 start_codon:yes stop_codon:yes gene_type:complete